MIKIEAIIRPSRLEEVKDALNAMRSASGPVSAETLHYKKTAQAAAYSE